MKQIVFVIILTLSFIILAIYVNIYLEITSNEISQCIDNICTYSNNGDWKKANIEAKLSSDIWKKTKAKWAIITEHSEIDMIETSIEKLKEYVKAQDISEVLAESANLRLLIKHIPEKYILNIENIL